MKKLCVVVLAVSSLVAIVEFAGKTLPRQNSILADGSDPMPLCRPQPAKPCPQVLPTR